MGYVFASSPFEGMKNTVAWLWRVEGVVVTLSCSVPAAGWVARSVSWPWPQKYWRYEVVAIVVATLSMDEEQRIALRRLRASERRVSL